MGIYLPHTPTKQVLCKLGYFMRRMIYLKSVATVLTSKLLNGYRYQSRLSIEVPKSIIAQGAAKLPKIIVP